MCSSIAPFIKLAAALNVEPFKFSLPQNKVVNYGNRRTKQLRGNLNALVNTVEDFLQEK